MKQNCPIKMVLLALGLISTVYACPSFAMTYSPYADLTINTHWDPETKDQVPMDLWPVSQKTNIKSYHLAFMVDTGNCNAAWGISAYPLDKNWGAKMIDTLRKNNVGYSIAFGGASGTDLSKNCSLHQLTDIYKKIITVYNAQSFDFDIENSLVDVTKLVRGILEVHRDYPNIKISFTLQVGPDGLTEQGRSVIRAATSVGLNYKINLMTMDYGPEICSGQMDTCSIEAATNTQKFLKSIYPGKSDAELWQMLEITPMIGVNDSPGEEITLANAKTLRDFAVKNNLNGIGIWSIMRDQPCSQKFPPLPNCSGNNLQTKPYEFSAAFLS